MFGGLHGMGLQPVLADAVGIGAAGLYRQHPCHPQLHRLLHNEICPRLLDRREQQPQIGRQAQGRGQSLAAQHPGPLARLFDHGPPLAIATVKDQNRRTRTQPHDVEEVIRLIFTDSNRLPRPQRLVYI